MFYPMLAVSLDCVLPNVASFYGLSMFWLVFTYRPVYALLPFSLDCPCFDWCYDIVYVLLHVYKTWTIQRNWQHWVNIHDILTPIKTWTIQRNWQHWVKHTRYLNTNQNMDNPEKMATKHTQDDMLTPIKTWNLVLIYRVCLPNVASFSGLSMFYMVLRYHVCFTQCCQFLWIAHVLIGVKISCMF
jgi:hypothetical protein